jgi:hypothetical protein
MHCEAVIERVWRWPREAMIVQIWRPYSVELGHTLQGTDQARLDMYLEAHDFAN